MNAVRQLLSELGRRDVRLWVEDDRLRFDAPKGALTDDLKAALRAHKDQVMDSLRELTGDGGLPPVTADLADTADPAAEPAPLSHQQERLWFLDRLVENSRAYNIPAFLRLHGATSARRLGHALTAITTRHETLRSVFPEEDGRPRQRIRPPAPVRLPVVDLSALAQEHRAPEWRRLTRAEARRPFDLGRGPLLRCALLRLAADDALLVINMHHVISDRWSTGVLLAELAVLYPEGSQEDSLPELPIQYRHYARWQKDNEDHPEIRRQLDYWREQLAGDLPLLELPIARLRTGPVRFEGRSFHFRLPQDLSDSLRTVARREGVTLFMLLLAAYKVLLYRYAGQRDLLIGTPVANRNDPAFEPMIGFFANTLVLRSEVPEHATFRRFLGRVKDTAVAAFRNQDVAFEKVVEAVNPERDLRHNPLFQAVFVLNTDEVPTLQLGAARVDPVVLETGSAKFDLLLALQDDPRGISGFFEYDVDLFPDDAVNRLQLHLSALLESVVATPHAPVDALSLITPAETRQIVRTWNRTEASYGADRCMHQLFEDRAAILPDRVAALCDGEAVTYGELNRRANRIAHYLIASGVEPGDFVAVCFRRSLDMIAGLLAVLKAGAAYVPLDPAYPQQRKENILRRTEAPVLLTQTGVVDGPLTAAARVVHLDRETFADRPDHDPRTTVTSDHLAYVIFTSGSTGEPKGVIVQHRPVINLIEWVNQSFRVGFRDRLLFVTSLCFDLSVYDVFGMLAAGGQVYIATEAELEDPVVLADVLCDNGITFWDSAPAALQRLAPFLYPGRGADSSLRLVFLSGDWIPLSLPPILQSTFPDLRFVGLGGATEATIWSNFFVVDEIEDGWKSVPYGMPIQNATYYTLDDRFQLSPVGIPGDLYIGGRCLSLGYFGQPALTAERYLPDPFSREPGSVLYRTGDRAMRWADGNLEFLGRLDEQVKIRGFRIELGEVEAVIRKHPAVREAKALARETSPGDKRLVAYVQVTQADNTNGAGHPERETLIDDLTGWARESLPTYMVPAVFVFLDQWPVTANGKLDRKALPAPEATGGDGPTRPPATPTEIALAAIWRELLHLDELGAEDNFFDLGGHSLLATQVISAVREAMGAELPLRELFAHPTVADLAARIDDLIGETSHRTPLLLHVSRHGRLPLSFSQERMWFLHRLEPDSGVYNIPAALRLSGRLDTHALVGGFAAIVARQEGLRTSFDERDNAPVQHIHDRVPIRLPVVDLTGLEQAHAEAEALRLAEADAGRPFRLDRAPLFRTTLLRLGAEDHIIQLNLHHIVSDGWSTGVMLRELVTFYNGLVGAGDDAETLPPLPIQYADYSVWQRKRAEVGDLDHQLDYWKQQLDGIPPALELPTDRPRKGAFRFHGGAHRWAFPKPLLGAIRERLQEEDVTLFIYLLSAFMVLLGRYSGQRDVVVGSPVANRNRKETEGLIGLFVNTLVFRGDLSGNPTFRGLLARVKAMAVDAYDHQDLPFEKLVETINPDRDLSRNPLFQIVFMVQNALAPTTPFEGLEFEVVPVENATAKFDLTMDLEERPDRLLGRVEYNADVFEAPTIHRMMEHYVHLLEDIVATPTRRLRQADLLGTEERQRILREWNDTADPAKRRDAGIHEPFEARAAAAPEAEAARLGSATVSYGAVNALANRVAHGLNAAGLGRGDLVAVCLPRCLEIPATLLGVLKAGAAYVPLDPAYPLERMRYILDRTGAKMLLTHSRMGDKLAGLERATDQQELEIRAVDGDAFDGYPDTDPPRRVTGDDLAYIIFTSGSTGTPKGVVLQHRPVLQLIEWVNDTYEVGPADRLLFLTSLCFDLSVYDVFGILAAGGTLEIAGDDDLGDPQRLMALLDGAGVTFWDSAPAALQQLVPFLPAAGTGSPDLRLVFLSGDWVPLSLPPALRKSFPNVQVIALGGATEAAIWSNHFPVADIAPHWRSVPYGRPIRNARYQVLDGSLRPCPVGVPGDLYIGGDVLSFCYYRQPALTAERYVPDPYSERPGDVLYTTGDRARWLPDGNLEFLGRLDHQVKIRGFRIELGEIETVLRKHPAVREGVVLAREDRPGDKQLAAYVEIKAGAGTPEEVEPDLRRHLHDRLTEYMVPPHVIFLDTWPVTSNGKLDRKALPAPADTVVEEGGERTAPRTPLENILAGLWADVLGLPEVGVDEDFFALGGHSILIAQIVGRLREVLGVEVPIRLLFELNTVEKLAEHVEAMGDDGDPDTHRMDEREDRRRAPLSFAQERLWLQYSLTPDSSAYNVPVAVRLHGSLRVKALKRALLEITRRHDVLRATFEPVEEGAEAVIDPQPRLRMRRVDLTGLPVAAREQAMRRLADIEADRPFTLEEGPVIRGLLIRLDGREHVLVVTVHHIAFDGLSVGVFIRELTFLYRELSAGRLPDLAPLTRQYGDYAVWQRRVLAGEALEEHLAFWQRTLQGAPPHLDLPSPKPRPEVMTDRGGVAPFRLEAEATAALTALSHHVGSTLFMTLLAAFDVVVYHQTRETDLVVGTDVGGRPHAAMEPMIGFFVNQLAIRVSLAGEPTFRQLLERVRAATLDAYDHQEAPFHKVVERLNPPRDRSRTPVVQLKLVFQQTPISQLRLGTLELSELLLGGQAVKFDVWLNVWPDGDGLTGRLEYNRDVLGRAQVERFVRQLTAVLGKVAYEPETKLSQLDRLLGSVEGGEKKRLRQVGKSLFQRRQRSKV